MTGHYGRSASTLILRALFLGERLQGLYLALPRYQPPGRLGPFPVLFKKVEEHNLKDHS